MENTFDCNYLINEVLPQRYKEISERKNDGTANPIYVVLDLRECGLEGHIVEYSPRTNLAEKPFETGYIENAFYKRDDDDGIENDKFYPTSQGMHEPKEVTRFWVDDIVAFFLTRKDAEDYLQYQAHNLSQAYIYTFYAGYSNLHLAKLLGKE